MLKWLKQKFLGGIAAIMLALPTFGEKKVEEHDGRDVLVDINKGSKLAEGGTVQRVDKFYGRTIAGGPGSQRIGDTFDALPAAEKQRMLDARKGIIRRTDADGLDHAEEGRERTSLDKLGRGADAAIARVYRNPTAMIASGLKSREKK